MTVLRDASDNEIVTLSCGCRVRRLKAVPNDFVRVSVLEPCKVHPFIKFLDGNEPVEEMLETLDQQRRALDLTDEKFK